jgi:ribosomal protein S18 acetylase RimI-like enzyme
VDDASVLASFDAQMRRRAPEDFSGGPVKRHGRVVRAVPTVAGRGWSGIIWSCLDAHNADAAIADQVAFFGARGERFEWKLYDYDQPPDLPARLLAAGFAPEAEEALMIAETAAQTVQPEPELPSGVRLVEVTGEAGISLLTEVGERVFGKDRSGLRATLTAQVMRAPESVAMIVAMAAGEPVAAARIEFPPGADFAGLWGGGTLPQWRGRGIYRALVGYRAQLAAARGYRYLQVDAAPPSKPILGRLGFSCLATTTPYVWSPASPAS